MSDRRTGLETTNTGTTYHVYDDGSKVIAPSRRPDGTLRKPIRVRAGYTPLEENVYKGPEVKQIAESRRERGCIPGMPEPPSPGAGRKAKDPHRIPGLDPGFANAAPAKPSKPKKQKDNAAKQDASTVAAANKTASSAKAAAAPPAAPEPAAPAKPENRLRNLRKKLLEIHTLQAKVDAEDESAVAPEVLQKISRKEEVEAEMSQLEAQLAELNV